QSIVLGSAQRLTGDVRVLGLRCSEVRPGRVTPADVVTGGIERREPLISLLQSGPAGLGGGGDKQPQCRQPRNESALAFAVHHHCVSDLCCMDRWSDGVPSAGLPSTAHSAVRANESCSRRVPSEPSVTLLLAAVLSCMLAASLRARIQYVG